MLNGGNKIMPRLHRTKKLAKTRADKPTNGLFFPFVVGLLFTLGNYAAQSGNLPVKTPRFWLTAIFFIALFILVFAGVYRLLNDAGSATVAPPSSSQSMMGGTPHHLQNTIRHARAYCRARADLPGAYASSSQAAQPLWKFEWHLSTPAVVRDMLRLLVCWIPMAFCMYPGLRGKDSSDMIGSFLGYPSLGRPAGVIWLHHPWFDTVFYGSFVKASLTLTGSMDAGLFSICLIQALIAALGFSLAFAWFASKGISRRVLTAATVFVAFFPIVPFTVFNINKDMTYACFLVLYCALTFIVLDDEEKILHNPAFDIFFIFLSVIVSQLIKSGVIIIAGALVLLLFVTRSWRRRLLAALAALAVLLFADVVAPLAIYPHLHAQKGNVSAALVAPLEMMARTAYLHPRELTRAQERDFRSYFNYSWREMGKRYNPFLVDSVVSPLGQSTRPGRPPRRFVRLWIHEGRQHPLEYAEAYVLLESGWYSFATVGSKPEIDWMVGVKENVFNPNIIVGLDALTSRYGPVEGNWRSRMFQDLYVAFASIPVLNLPAFLSLYQSILPAFALYVLWRRRHLLGGRRVYRSVAACGVWLLTIASTWFAAVSQGAMSSSASRYAYPSLFLSPLILLLLTLLMGKMDHQSLHRSVIAAKEPQYPSSKSAPRRSLSHRPAIN